MLAAVLAVSAVCVIMFQRTDGGSPADPNNTNYNYIFDEDDPHADPRLVGKWQNIDNPQWYKMYLDDYDEDGYFWGKEWDESEDVFEEDLKYHGNGWFRWKRDKKEVQEIASTDEFRFTVSKNYAVKIGKDSVLQLTDRLVPSVVFRFRRPQIRTPWTDEVSPAN